MTIPEMDHLAALLPDFEFLELLGRGGMGVVYKARQRRLNRLVAIKVFDPDLAEDTASAERFTREAQILASLNHPNIVAVYDVSAVDRYRYMVMEYVEGVDLAARIHAGDLELSQVLSIIPQICDAMQYPYVSGRRENQRIAV